MKRSGSNVKSETKIYSNPTRRHRGTLKDSEATLIHIADPDNYVGVFITLGYPRLYFVR